MLEKESAQGDRHTTAPILFPPWVPRAPILHIVSHNYFLGVFIAIIDLRAKRHLTVVLTGISLISNDSEHLFMGLCP